MQDPGEPSRLALYGTYGLLTTNDAGKTWGHVCEAATGPFAGEAPLLEILAGGRLLLSSETALRGSTFPACDWRGLLEPELPNTVQDITREPTSDGGLLALLNEPDVSVGFRAAWSRSSDGGESWTGSARVPAEILAQGLTIDVAPSRPERVYLSGLDAERNGVLARSDDAGTTWHGFAIAGTGADEPPYLAQIDSARRKPSLRAHGYFEGIPGQLQPDDALLFSADGGTSFVRVVSRRAKLLGFALSPDGETLLLGYGDPVLFAYTVEPEQTGLYRLRMSDLIASPETAAAKLEKIYAGSVTCLRWTEHGLFACLAQAERGFEVGRANDAEFSLSDAQPFTPLLDLKKLAPLACAAESTASVCSSDLNTGWPAVCAKLGADCAATGGDSAEPKPQATDAAGCGCRVVAFSGGTAERRLGAHFWLILGIFGLASHRRRSRCAARPDTKRGVTRNLATGRAAWLMAAGLALMACGSGCAAGPAATTSGGQSTATGGANAGSGTQTAGNGTSTGGVSSTSGASSGGANGAGSPGAGNDAGGSGGGSGGMRPTASCSDAVLRTGPPAGKEALKTEPIDTKFPFSTHWMGRFNENPAAVGITGMADFDHDGDLDFASGQRGGQMQWWEYCSPDHWAQHVVGTGHNSPGGGNAVDVDGDGWVDLIAGDSWYKNPQTPQPSTNWPRHSVGVAGAEDIAVGDIDGDGKQDVVWVWDQIDAQWRKPGADPTAAWPLGAAFQYRQTQGGFIGDVDGDGKNDVLVGKQYWYKNVDGKGTMWQTVNFPNAFDDSPLTTMGDLDGDGDLDFAMCTHFGNRVAWFENADGKGTTMTMHAVATGKNKLHAIFALDFDNDGDLDIYSARAPGRLGFGKTRRQGSVHRARGVEHRARARRARGDVDCDGDLDIVGKPWGEGEAEPRDHIYLKNELVEKGGKAVFTRPKGEVWHPTEQRQCP